VWVRMLARLSTLFSKPGAVGAIEQAIHAASHFLLAVLVFRFKGSANFAGYSFGYALLLFSFAVVSSFVTEPYSVLRRSKAPVALLGAAIGAVLGLASLAVEVVSLDSSEANGWPLMSAVSFSSAYWVRKAKLYREGHQIHVLYAALIYSMTMLGLFIVLRGRPFLCITVAAAITSMPSLMSEVRNERVRDVIPFLVAARPYALWALVAALATWVINNIYFVVLPLVGRPDAAAGLRASFNMVVPINTLVVGATTALLPRLAEEYRQQGGEALYRSTKRLLIFASSGGALLSFTLLVCGPEMMKFVYGSDRYASIVRAVAILPLVWTITLVVRASLRAAAMSRQIFCAYAIAAVPVGLPLALMSRMYSDTAAAAGAVLMQMIAMIAISVFFFKAFRRVAANADH
jgi:O-antigen/teichoic acid export membrane protein